MERIRNIAKIGNNSGKVVGLGLSRRNICKERRKKEKESSTNK